MASRCVRSCWDSDIGGPDPLQDALAKVERLTALLEDACKVFDHYDLPEHAFHYRRQLAGGRADG